MDLINNSKKRNLGLIFSLSFIALTVLIDQLLKSWALGLALPMDILGLKFFAIANQGIFGGFLADLDPWIIRIFFTVLFGFLCIGSSLAMHFLRHHRIPLFKAGLLVYVSGIFGNVLDRMMTGAVTDYILVPTVTGEGMAFNYADLMVFVGFLLILCALFRESNQLWFRDNKRGGFWVEPRFQLHFGLIAAFVGFAHFFVIAIYSYVFLKVFITSMASVAEMGPERIIRDYLFGLFVIEGAALILSFMVSILISHRLVGPIIALEHFLTKKLANDDGSTLKLRRADYFRERLETVAGKFTTVNKLKP